MSMYGIVEANGDSIRAFKQGDHYENAPDQYLLLKEPPKLLGFRFKGHGQLLPQWFENLVDTGQVIRDGDGYIVKHAEYAHYGHDQYLLPGRWLVAHWDGYQVFTKHKFEQKFESTSHD